MSAHDQLERQLRASVVHNTDRRLPSRLRPRPSSHGLPALLVAVSSVAALGVAVFVLVSLHHRRAPAPHPATPVTGHHVSRRPPAPSSLARPPRNADLDATAAAFNVTWKKDPACRPGSGERVGTVSQGSPSAAILSELPVLRRPATRADRLPTRLYPGGPGVAGPNGRDIYVRYIRRARVADGRSFYLEPDGKVGQPPLSQAAADRCYQLEAAALRAQLPKVPPSKRAATRRYGDAQFTLGRRNLTTSSVHEGVFLVDVSANGGGIDAGQGPATIQQTGMLGGGGSPSAGIVMDGIVPSGVATVTLQFPATRHAGRRLPALSATGNVVNDVFVIPIPTLFQRGGWPTTAIWRSASGTVIKTVDERPFHP